MNDTNPGQPASIEDHSRLDQAVTSFAAALARMNADPAEAARIAALADLTDTQVAAEEYGRQAPAGTGATGTLVTVPPAGSPQAVPLRRAGSWRIPSGRVELVAMGNKYILAAELPGGTVVALEAPPAVVAVAASPASAKWEADHFLTEIYLGEYRSLVRLAVLLVHDVPTAEEIVQEAFIAMHSGWRRLRDTEKALAYLRQAVINRSRSALRHRTVINRHALEQAPDEPSAESGAIMLLERSAVITALRGLPARQREAIVLRYYVDMSEAEIAAAMGISRGAVRSHTARAMAALKSVLEQETS